MGGAEEYSGVMPHLSAWGKAMANGFSVSAVSGAREIMRLGSIDPGIEKTFLLSSTHGGETHSLAAAIATITEIKENDIVSHFWSVGSSLQDGIKNAATDTGMQDLVNVFGYPCKPGVSFNDLHGVVSAEMRTLFLQETISRGLMVPYIVPSWSHKKPDVDRAISIIHESLREMSRHCDSMSTVRDAIEGDIVQPVFRRVN